MNVTELKENHLIYHTEIVNFSHRKDCLECQQAFTTMSMIIDLSGEKNES